MEDHMALQEAASAGLKSMEHLIGLLSSQSQAQTHQTASSSSSSSFTNNNLKLNLNNLDCSQITDFTVSKFKQVINLLNRTGHARFRRAPTQQPNPIPEPEPDQEPQIHAQQHGLTLDFSKPKTLINNTKSNKDETLSMSTTTSSFMSTITTGDPSVSDGKIGPFLAPPPAPAPSAAKPPLSSSHRKRCHDATVSGNKASSSGNCHCSKRRYFFFLTPFFENYKEFIVKLMKMNFFLLFRKSRVRRTIHVPAISSKIADIPPDEYSWRKYGQKPIKGSPYPRYYSILVFDSIIISQTPISNFSLCNK